MKRFFNDIYLNGNILHDAKVNHITEIADPQSVINKHYADTLQLYASTFLSDADVQILPLQEIKDKSDIEGLTLSQIFDKLFFSRKLHQYTKPIVIESSTAVFKRVTDDSIINDDIIEIGSQIYLDSNYQLVLNDSSGLGTSTYTINSIIEGSPSSLIITESFPSTIFTGSQFTSRKEQLCEVLLNYNVATVHNDSHNDPDTVGYDNSYFQAGQFSKALSLKTYWAKFISVFDNVPTTNDGSTFRSVMSSGLANAKFLDKNEQYFNDSIVIDVNSFSTIVFAIPEISPTLQTNVELFFNDENITSFVTESICEDVRDAANSTSTTMKYNVYTAELPASVSEKCKLSIKTTII